jgi:tRNA threonylcarbamoyladenosine biosynthesis protein TsaB
MDRPLIAFDTATRVGSVAIGTAQRVAVELSLGVAHHSESLLPAVSYALARAGTMLSDVGGVVVGAGPGSFTGVRISASTAKGLVHALGIPLYAYSSLAMIAAGASNRGRPVCAMFDARRGEVYASCYRVSAGADGGPEGVETVIAPTAGPIDEFLRLLSSHDPIYVGDGALRYAERVRRAGGQIAPAVLAIPRASSLLWLAGVDPDGGRITDPDGWSPEYVRPPGARPTFRS